MSHPFVFRPVFGRILTVVVILLCGFFAVQTFVVDPAGGWLVLAPAAFLAVGAWALYWQPSVSVDSEAITVRNILRTVRIPWARLTRIDTRYTLTLETDDGRTVGSWASPAPGAVQSLRLDKRRLAKLPESTYLDGTVRPGDDENTDSGVPALVIRREWERRADDPDTGAGVTSSWHLRTVVALSVLLVAAVASVLVTRLG